jgi:hypothetical protein
MDSRVGFGVFWVPSTALGEGDKRAILEISTYDQLLDSETENTQFNSCTIAAVTMRVYY